MSTGYTKPQWHELREDLKLIAELPERINEYKRTRLLEILVYIDQERENRLIHIYHLLDVQPGSTFEHWAENVSSVFNLNQLNALKDFIINHLNIKRAQRSKDQEHPEIITQVFKTGGFEVFNYLDEHFTALNNIPTIKYTVLYFFLEGKHVYPNKSKFIVFVQSYCKNSLKDRTFSKIESDYNTHPNFKNHKPKLTSLYYEYLETSKS
ncbi:hypothetical protein [Altibacter sp.]|uniref:hypothetical protein n=1 Tax=Altibacter sp. TaxID=2024823 RepID=UPI0025C5F3F0|nr:hypothetical protein [Altibacter sp.]|tara:strand:+ start:525 stop:1151 length:627 start_codon:yes stop_codon:yes gene_type:complete